jgi:carbonic anhydrase
MSEIDELLRANLAYSAARADLSDARPSRRLAVITCMDARIDVFDAFGLRLGEAHVMRNAGGRVTEDVLRSLALSTAVLGVETAVFVQHTLCGLAGRTDDELRQATGADLAFLSIEDHGRALRQDVDLVARTSYLDGLRTVSGLLYDVETGRLEDVVRWERARRLRATGP